MSKHYLAFIADLIDSRHIVDRAKVQERIKSELGAINRQFAGILVSNFTLTLGDEFQALLEPLEAVSRLIDEIDLRLDLPLRIGLGYGTLLTAVDPTQSIGADGEAYWRAREALNELKADDGQTRVKVSGFGEWQDPLLNSLLETTELIKRRWTTLQRDTVKAMLEADIYSDSFLQVEFAKTLGIRPSSLTKRLSAGNVKPYIRARRIFARTMEIWHVD